jgi:hypothetical protein
VARAAGLEPEPIAGGALSWANWAAGVVSVYATLFGVGKLIFASYGEAAAYLGVAVAAFALIARNLGREERSEHARGSVAEPAVAELSAR